jgi:hypothetical protein
MEERSQLLSLGVGYGYFLQRVAFHPFFHRRIACVEVGVSAVGVASVRVGRERIVQQIEAAAHEADGYEYDDGTEAGEQVLVESFHGSGL